ncbi:MAG: universal stress protein [Pseudotabrizicola sp.]|uniref:universal stress protein n=1 Tax=Pseudotabrizicola sp. TaxID=2939647 RepID=UPI00271902DE|nr:universal stress protein [Pseudotabrizicola sp.]MDO8884675.1 universal stress protein [Pseudotabrizicola sp.]MDP2080184.1 universal stress protein [Pseudotabrizicola sp.]MDZ7572339.1 universal stress protein [Pseudotabrizicola sp.]
MLDRIAYLPLNAHPETASDAAILGAIRFASALGCKVHVSTFAVEFPPVPSPIGGYLINVEALSRAAEARSRAECKRLQALVETADGPGIEVSVTSHEVVVGEAPASAATEARYFDLSLVLWSAEPVAIQDMAQALIFGSGLPVILVPPTVAAATVDHIAIAWDESRVAARALGDALRILRPRGKVSVLTVQDEKALNGTGLAQTLASALVLRGYDARAVNLTLDGKSIAMALQDAALVEGAQILAMGGFGHSRIRDFILGGATKGVLGDLRMPVLLAH